MSISKNTTYADGAKIHSLIISGECRGIILANADIDQPTIGNTDMTFANLEGTIFIDPNITGIWNLTGTLMSADSIVEPTFEGEGAIIALGVSRDDLPPSSNRVITDVTSLQTYLNNTCPTINTLRDIHSWFENSFKEAVSALGADKLSPYKDLINEFLREIKAYTAKQESATDIASKDFVEGLRAEGRNSGRTIM